MTKKHKFVLPHNFLEFRKYFSWMQLRNFDMLSRYIAWDVTYKQLWFEHWISRERVRQCLLETEQQIYRINYKI